MKKTLIAIAAVAALLIPFLVYGATSVPLITPSIGSGYVFPASVNGVFQAIRADYFTSTSTTATSTFANHISIGTDKEYRIGGIGVLTKKSNNAVILGDLTGNARGDNAIDVQSARTADTQVASGPGAIAVGANNTASGIILPSIAVGLSNTASGIASAAFGISNTCSSGNATCFGKGNNVSGTDGSSGFGISLTNPFEHSAMFGISSNYLIFRDPDNASPDYPTPVGVVGLGSSTPYAKLSIHATDFPASRPLFVVATSSSNVSTTTVFNILGNGNVGVGTTSPFTNLSVTGNIHASGNITCGGTCGGGSGTVNSSTAGYNAYYASTGSAVSGTSTLFMSPTERVGVGTLLPAVKFHSVINTGTIAGAFERNATSNGSSVVQIGSTNSALETATVSGIKNSSAGTLSLQTGSTAIGTEGTDRLYILSTGNVGIASTTPWGLLSVNPSSIGAAPAFVVGSSTATHLIVSNSGNVGMGTTSPYAKLSVVGQAVAAYFTATTTTASIFPYASSTALTVTGRTYLGTGGAQAVIGTTAVDTNAALRINNTSVANQLVIGNGSADTTHTVDIYTPSGSSQNNVSLIRTANTQNNFLQFQPQGANTSSNVNWLMGSVANSNNFSFSTWNGGSVTEYLSVTNNTGGGFVGLSSSTPSSLLSVGSSGTATSTVFVDSGTGKGSCLVMKDSDGTGFTYITANNGVLSASTVSCR